MNQTKPTFHQKTNSENYRPRPIPAPGEGLSVRHEKSRAQKFLAKVVIASLVLFGAVETPTIINNLKGPDVPTLPAPDSPEARTQLDSGKLVLVHTDDGHTTLSSVAQAVMPEQDYRGLENAIVDEIGHSDVPLGTSVVVPDSPAAEALHNQQYLNQAK